MHDGACGNGSRRGDRKTVVADVSPAIWLICSLPAREEFRSWQHCGLAANSQPSTIYDVSAAVSLVQSLLRVYSPWRAAKAMQVLANFIWGFRDQYAVKRSDMA